MNDSTFGIVGLGTMGRNLALNMASRGVRVAVWNLEPQWIDDFLAAHPSEGFVGARTFEALAAVLGRPRRIMMMIPAGKPVDEVIGKLRGLLEPGDVLIDGGNSWFEDTRRRESALRADGLHFVGCGVSGGEDGARYGPSLMPGGSVESWLAIRDVLEAIAARTDAGPCVTHVGPDGSGHFVKMAHNGIEYADMQLIAEAWDVMRRGLAMSAAETADVFERWNQGPLESFLVELTARVCRVVDAESGEALVDRVLDKAGQKGTGRWTAQVALDLAVPVPTIAAAIDARVLSSMKEERERASRAIQGPPPDVAFNASDRARIIDDLADGLHASRICAYAQGLALIRAESLHCEWNVNLAEIARIWRAGCIIRARLLDPVRHAFGRQPGLSNLVLDPEIGRMVAAAGNGWRKTVARAASSGVPMPAHATALAYFDSYRTARLPQNLIQAQRDAFGAHTYERIDRAGPVHSDWTPPRGRLPHQSSIPE